MKRPLFFLALLLTGIVACKKESVEGLNPPPVILADSVAGTYSGVDVYTHSFLATGTFWQTSTPMIVTVTINPNLSNSILIGSQTYILNANNTFNLVNPNPDFHVHDDGIFRFDSLGGATISYTRGFGSMSGSDISTFTGTRQ